MLALRMLHWIRPSVLGVLWLVVMTFPAAGEESAAPAPAEERVTFTMAVQALDDGEAPVARMLLGQLVEADSAAPEDAVYQGLIMLAEGRRTSAAEALEKVFATSAESEFSRPWVYEELVRRVGTVRLARLWSERAAELEEVLARHYEARGGLERLLELSDLVATGRLVIGDQELPFRLARKRPRFYRLDVITGQGVWVRATDGQVSWEIAPGSTEPVTLAPAIADDLVAQSHFDDVLVRFRKTGERPFLVGTEVRDGEERVRIDVAMSGQRRIAVFLDPQSFLESERFYWFGANEDPASSTFEYRDVDGLPLIARQVLETPDGGVTEYVFDEYVVDRPIDPALFSMESAQAPEAPPED